MGTCDEVENPNENEITLEISSNGTHHDVVVEDHDSDDDHQNQDQNQNQNENETLDDDDDDENETPAIVDKLESLELQDNGGEELKDEEIHDYPLRPNAMNCSFYIKTGSCKFGQNCKFNHPPDREIQDAWDKEKRGEENNGPVSDTGKIECKYFSTPGGCKYGDYCRYNHSKVKIEAKGLELNFLGLPVRPLEKECNFYMRNGTCKYGANCRYHHPDPTSAKDFDRNSLANGSSLRGDNGFRKAYESSHSSGAFQGSLPGQSNGMNMRDSLPYAASMNSYHHGMLQNPGWIQNQVTMPLPTNMAPLPHQIMNNFSKPSDPSTHFEPVMQIDEFPVRPGQPNCDYFMKTGDCKYRSACRYNHPSSRAPNTHLPSLSMKGSYPTSATVLPVQTTELPNLNPNNTRKNGVPYHQQMQNGEFPERPGQPECEYFMKTGNCKFRSACRYHHPKNRVSTSSPTALNEKGLPLRPGSRICRNYEQQGVCKYGSKCLFHHPDDNFSADQVSSFAAPQDDSSTNVPVTATDSELPKSSNDASDWGDGWAM